MLGFLNGGSRLYNASWNFWAYVSLATERHVLDARCGPVDVEHLSIQALLEELLQIPAARYVCSISGLRAASSSLMYTITRAPFLNLNGLSCSSEHFKKLATGGGGHRRS